MSIDVFVRDLLAGSATPAAEDDVALRATPLFSSGRLASVHFVKLLLRVEEEVGEIEDDDLSEENFDTLGAIEALLARYRAKAAPIAAAQRS